MNFKEWCERNYDRPLKTNESAKGICPAVAKFVYVCLVIFCKVCFRYDVQGREVLKDVKKKHSGAVIFSNHCSYIEVIMAYICAMHVQWTRFIGKAPIFEKANYFVGWLASLVGAFPVARDSADLGVVKRAVKDLKNGEFVQIYPEGTRRGRGSAALRLHSGGTLMARMAKAPIIPSACRNADQVKRKGERLRFKKLTYVYGQPLYVSDFDFLPKKERLDACTWYAMRECYALFYDMEPEQVDMKNLFPEDRDFTAELAGVVLESRKALPSKED